MGKDGETQIVTTVIITVISEEEKNLFLMKSKSAKKHFNLLESFCKIKKITLHIKKLYIRYVIVFF